MDKNLDGYITMEEYASRVGVHLDTARRYRREGRIPGAIRSGAAWLVPEVDRIPDATCNALVSLRTRQGLSRQRVAEKMSASMRGSVQSAVTTLYRLEHNECSISNVSLRVAIAIADALGVVDLRDLIDDKKFIDNKTDDAEAEYFVKD